jgi:hypothetical protein
MPTLQALQDAAAVYNRQFQDLTARIYEDGFVSCQEAIEGTRYYRGTRPHLRRVYRLIRAQIVALYRHNERLIEHQTQTSASANETLRPYYTTLHDFDKLLNDSQVMLKIFADVLRDCPDETIRTEQEA